MTNATEHRMCLNFPELNGLNMVDIGSCLTQDELLSKGACSLQIIGGVLLDVNSRVSMPPPKII